MNKLSESVSLDEWEKICKKAVTQAIQGNARERKFLSNYLIGRPMQGVRITGPGDTPLSLSMVIAVIREAVNDDDILDRINAAFEAIAKGHAPLPVEFEPDNSQMASAELVNGELDIPSDLGLDALDDDEDASLGRI
jgi:hypothetical protein